MLNAGWKWIDQNSVVKVWNSISKNVNYVTKYKFNHYY